MNESTRLALPADWYHRQDIWQDERRRIFATEWIWVACEEALRTPGRFVTVMMAGYPLLLWRDPEGELRAFHNVCRHRAMQLLTDPSGTCSRLVCPYHGWVYANDGELIRAPRFEGGDDFDPADYGLFPVRLVTWQGLVFVCLDENTPEFDSWFGPLKSSIDDYLATNRIYHGDIGEDVECNWKNYVDNYQEGYHIPLVHPRLARDTEWPDYRVVNLSGGSVHQVAARGGSGQPGLFGWRFPNFMFNTYGEGVSFMRIDPLGPGRCHVHYSHFRPADMAPETYDEKIVAYGWEISTEDQFITPLVQQNLEAGIYQAGPLSPRHENGLWHFHDMVRERLSAGSAT